jgi:hypothetical protein
LKNCPTAVTDDVALSVCFNGGPCSGCLGAAGLGGEVSTCITQTCPDCMACPPPGCVEPEVCVLGECKGSNGTPCSSTAATSCASGLCVDGVCCNSECDGPCEACNLAATNGVCSTCTECTACS